MCFRESGAPWWSFNFHPDNMKMNINLTGQSELCVCGWSLFHQRCEYWHTFLGVSCVEFQNWRFLIHVRENTLWFGLVILLVKTPCYWLRLSLTPRSHLFTRLVGVCQPFHLNICWLLHHWGYWDGLVITWEVFVYFAKTDNPNPECRLCSSLFWLSPNLQPPVQPTNQCNPPTSAVLPVLPFSVKGSGEGCLEENKSSSDRRVHRRQTTCQGGLRSSG